MSNYSYVIYRTATGEIVGAMNSDYLGDLDQYGPDTTALEVPNSIRYIGGSHYVKNGAVVPKMTMAPTITGTTLGSLPIPCHVKSNGGAWDVTDGVAELAYAHAGTYDVEITALHYFPYKTTVTQL